jgi:hypothetical protein
MSYHSESPKESSSVSDPPGSGPGSGPDDSSSGLSEPFGSSSSGGSSSGSSGYCDWTITFVVLYTPKTGEFFVVNTGTVDLTVSSITMVIPDYIVTPPLPVTVLPGDSAVFIVSTEAGDVPGPDLAGETVTVATSCGTQAFVF